MEPTPKLRPQDRRVLLQQFCPPKLAKVVRSTLLQFPVQAGPSGKTSSFDKIYDFGDENVQIRLIMHRICRISSNGVVCFNQSLIWESMSKNDAEFEQNWNFDICRRVLRALVARASAKHSLLASHWGETKKADVTFHVTWFVELLSSS